MRVQQNNKPGQLNLQQLPSSSNTEQQQAQEYDTFLYKFQQQIIDAWKPVPHTSSNIILYSVLSVICIGLGLALILTAPNSQQVNVRYDNANACPIGTTGCSVSFTLTQTLQAPIYMYYSITNFYQNHRRYIKFFSSLQMSSGSLQQSDAQSNCGDFKTNAQLGYTVSNTSLPLTGSDIGFPCGTAGNIYNKFRPQLITFGLKYAANVTTIPIRKNGIAWPSDIGRFKDFDLNRQPFSIQQEDWLVWYRPGARQGWHKLFGIVDKQLIAGSYQITFDNIFNASFGQKHFYIGKANYMGNRDLFLGIAFLVLGGGCFILLIVFTAKWIAQKRDKPHYN